VYLAALGGLRWAECAGLAWGVVDLDNRRLKVTQVAVETPSTVSLRPFPKSRAGQRVVPLPPALTESLMNHRNRLVTATDDADLVFPSRTGDRYAVTTSGDVSGCRHLSALGLSAGSRRPKRAGERVGQARTVRRQLCAVRIRLLLAT
jgi:integrase